MKKLMIAVLVLLGMCGVSKAQSYYVCPDGQEVEFNYALSTTSTTSGSTLVTPSQMTTVAATISVGAGTSSTSGNTLAPQSHSITVTPGTYLYYQWQSYHAASASSWLTINGTLAQGWNYFNTLSGTTNNQVAQSEVGNTYVEYFQATDASGHTTRDRITIKVVAGSGPSVVSSDNLHSNVYFNYVGSISGGMIGGSCTGDQNRRAEHTVQLTNASSGESHPQIEATTAQVCPLCQVPQIPVDSISVLPGDSFTFNASVIIQMNCEYTMLAAATGPLTPAIESAWTQVQDLGQPGIPGPRGKEYYLVAVDCSSKTTPPDWSPRQVLSPTRPTYELGVTMCERWPNVEGLPWICAASVVEDYGAGGVLNWVSMSVVWLGGSYDCTNHDKGFSGYPFGFTWPFPF